MPAVEASQPKQENILSPIATTAPACPVCGSRRLHYLFSVVGSRVVRCEDCLLMLRDPRAFAARSSGSAGTAADGPAVNLPHPDATCLDLLERYRGRESGRMLGVARGGATFLAEAVRRGFAVTAVDRADPASLEHPATDGNGFDVVALYDVLDTVPDPERLLRQAHARLAPGGVLFVASLSFDRWAAQGLRQRWTVFRPEECFYFTRPTLETLLIHSGFREIIARADVPDGMVFMARPGEERTRQVLSLVVPVFNEAHTFVTNFEKLLAKTVPGLDIEIVVVESNSTDGTRDLVARYQDHPRVTVVWEDRPRGKGHAVRGGLERITGDYVLIQDADLEYDLEDYEALLEPLVQGHTAFVLGARHGGSAWKMRSFTGQPVVSAVLNGAHWFFTMLVNVGFQARLKDPFTMYKVFRRDCLYGLEFECNRFDFDFELVIKLLRKGYQPLEIPVNYRSRSFAEGKKVSFFGDPVTWLKALVKFRLQPMDPLENVVRARRRRESARATAAN